MVAKTEETKTTGKRTLTGSVVSDKMDKTVDILDFVSEFQATIYVPKKEDR